MSISLNNHETRIKKLESGGMGSWEKGSNSNGSWFREKSTGLIIQFGISTRHNYDVECRFPIPFSSTNYHASLTKLLNSYECTPYQIDKQKGTYKVRFVWKGGEWSTLPNQCSFLAIGY